MDTLHFWAIGDIAWISSSRYGNIMCWLIIIIIFLFFLPIEVIVSTLLAIEVGLVSEIIALTMYCLNAFVVRKWHPR